MGGINKGALSLLLVITGLFVWSFQAAAQPPNPKETVKNFVQEFYDWYNAVSHKNNNKLAADQRAIREKAQIVNPALIKALNEDYQESSKHPAEVVGLDWDPFLCSQDLDDRYETGGVKSHGQNYLVEVYGIYKGSKNKEPNVIAEVARNKGRLIFVNFHSPHGGDLLSDLKRLKENREKNRYQH